MPGIEVLLPLGAIAFYLYDSALLLFSNERLLTRQGGQWQIAANAGLFLMGRTVYAPGLLLPHRPLFRLLMPTTQSPTVAASHGLAEFLRALRPLQWLVWLLLVLLVAALPLVSWWYGAGPHMLAVFIAYYVVLLAALSVTYWRRAALGLTRKAFAALAFDVCACAPFGVNLVAKLSLRRCLSGDALHDELTGIAEQLEQPRP
jgi:hypothetical protein